MCVCRAREMCGVCVCVCVCVCGGREGCVQKHPYVGF